MKKIKRVYLFFKDTTETDPITEDPITEDLKGKEQNTDPTKEDGTEEGGMKKEEGKKGDGKKEGINKPKAKSEKEVKITLKEFEEYKNFKLNNMTQEEREKALKEDNENFKSKIDILEKTIDKQNNLISSLKAQESIKEKLNTVNQEKPYLNEIITKRSEKGFNSTEEVNDFVNLVDSPTLKQAYEVLQKTQKATKLTGTSLNTNTNSTVTYQPVEEEVDLSKYGLNTKK
ncbi:MAG: hypothetical protein KA384_08875 [Leptotrichiaceae bacterium]|nr:hypothetical protein [Leptotrichiaceae bacterium]